jgi:hypothetical protein
MAVWTCLTSHRSSKYPVLLDTSRTSVLAPSAIAAQSGSFNHSNLVPEPWLAAGVVVTTLVTEEFTTEVVVGVDIGLGVDRGLLASMALTTLSNPFCTADSTFERSTGIGATGLGVGMAAMSCHLSA